MDPRAGLKPRPYIEEAEVHIPRYFTSPRYFTIPPYFLIPQ
jgi:hypothetical protein